MQDIIREEDDKYKGGDPAREMHDNVKEDENDQECKLPVQAALESNHEGEDKIERDHQATYTSVRDKAHSMTKVTA